MVFKDEPRLRDNEPYSHRVFTLPDSFEIFLDPKEGKIVPGSKQLCISTPTLGAKQVDFVLVFEIDRANANNIKRSLHISTPGRIFNGDTARMDVELSKGKEVSKSIETVLSDGEYESVRHAIEMLHSKVYKEITARQARAIATAIKFVNQHRIDDVTLGFAIREMPGISTLSIEPRA